MRDMAELIRLGAYRAGADAELDRAIAVHPALERVLEQDALERSTARRPRSRPWPTRWPRADGPASKRRATELLARLERHALDEQRLALAALQAALAGRRAELAALDRRTTDEHAAGWALPGGPQPLAAYAKAAQARRRVLEDAERAAQLAVEQARVGGAGEAARLQGARPRRRRAATAGGRGRRAQGSGGGRGGRRPADGGRRPVRTRGPASPAGRRAPRRT